MYPSSADGTHGDDKALLFGGHHGYGNYSSETWVYDLSDANWTLKNPVTDPGLAGRHAMARIGDDKAVVFTGSETWVYDLSDNNWTQMSPLSSPPSRVWATMAYLGDDQAILFGGETGNFPRTPYGDTWIYDLSDDTWTEYVDSPHPTARSYPAACETSLDASTDIVVFSGATGYSPAGTPTERSKETWTFGAP